MENSILKLLIAFLLFAEIIFSQPKKENKNFKPIFVGFSISLFNDVDIRDAEAAIKMWGNELLKNMHSTITPETQIFENSADLVSAINKNQVDLIALPTLDFLEIRNKANIEPNLITSINGKHGYDFIVVVRKDKNIKKLQDLKNAIVNIPTKITGNLTKMWLTVFLHEKKINIDNFFKEIKEYDKPSQALLPVFFNQADVCVIPSMSYNTMLELNPQLKKELVIIETSPILVNGLMCLNKSIEPDLKKSLLQAASKLGKTPSGKQILNLFKSEDVIIFEEKHIKEIQILNEKYSKIIKAKK
ncbi:MAG: PhnD/SsuA/transferrin family substrate-binding protein [Ignavibacteriae bacterium]|nr:PhnD/SsuA/transferrin family substrate-binding protein [Ignavibacteriota bacterium]